MSRLDDAFENLYEAFADVRKPQTIEGCPCCWRDQDSRTLLNGNLRESPLKELGIYAWSVMSTIGSADDFLYFLPRILHLTTIDTNGWGPDVEVIARAIHATEPQTWPDHRRRALEEYLSAVMYTSLAPGRHREIDTWLFVIAQIGLDVRPHLHSIEQSMEAVLDYFSDNACDLPQRQLTNSSWKKCHAGHEAIVAWFYSPRIRKIVFDAYGCVLPSGE